MLICMLSKIYVADSGLEFKLAYSQNASQNSNLRQTFVQARKKIRVHFLVDFSSFLEMLKLLAE